MSQSKAPRYYTCSEYLTHMTRNNKQYHWDFSLGKRTAFGRFVGKAYREHYKNNPQRLERWEKHQKKHSHKYASDELHLLDRIFLEQLHHIAPSQDTGRSYIVLALSDTQRYLLDDTFLCGKDYSGSRWVPLSQFVNDLSAYNPHLPVLAIGPTQKRNVIGWLSSNGVQPKWHNSEVFLRAQDVRRSIEPLYKHKRAIIGHC